MHFAPFGNAANPNQSASRDKLTIALKYVAGFYANDFPLSTFAGHTYLSVVNPKGWCQLNAGRVDCIRVAHSRKRLAVPRKGQGTR